MQKIFKRICSFILIMLITGCQTAQQATNQTGNVIGQGAKTTGGVTEGITNGYVGTVTSQDNPYGR
jgi:hypothetical protein